LVSLSPSRAKVPGEEIDPIVVMKRKVKRKDKNVKKAK
jgi:hypothetical protein